MLVQVVPFPYTWSRRLVRSEPAGEDPGTRLESTVGWVFTRARWRTERSGRNSRASLPPTYRGPCWFSRHARLPLRLLAVAPRAYLPSDSIRARNSSLSSQAGRSFCDAKAIRVNTKQRMPNPCRRPHSTFTSPCYHRRQETDSPFLSHG